MKFLFFVLVLVFSLNLLAHDKSAIESLSVIGQKENLPTRPGSAHILTQEELKKFDYNDITRVLRGVPGVNIQEEDGFGLRPSIGLRGAHPHRSKKISIMEDGVLIAPAPYSAPSAYFFPLLDQYSSIEVYKGTPSVIYGPNSIGGAINLLTRVNDRGAEVDLSYGSFNYQKYDMSVGIETFGDFTIDLTRITHDGFKDLNTGDDTGFERNNVTVRWDKYFIPLDQNFNIKLNWSNELSNETYVGLSETDFNNNPFQRYSGTQEDRMDWESKKLFISYALTPHENGRLRATVYRNEFNRSWFKLQSFADGPKIADVLADPTSGANQPFYSVLTGAADSSLAANADELRVRDNIRSYYSQGVQFKYDYEIDTGVLLHWFSLGYRFHQDHEDKKNLSSYFAMRGNQLVGSMGLAQELDSQTESDAEAHTYTMTYELTWEDLIVSTAARIEDIEYKKTNLVSSSVKETSENFLAPGLGVFYQAFEKGGFLFGVHKGFTAVGPGQNSNIDPEEATNYELGVRYNDNFGLELIGFFSDYQNILGTCTVSSGCTSATLDERFNGGKAQVKGAELLVSKDFKSGSLTFPIQLAGTWTQTEFKNDFASTLSEWGSGNVKMGDPIPYIPEFQANLKMGVEWKKCSSFFNFNYLGKMADQAVESGRKYIDSRWVLDYTYRYQISGLSQLYFKADNITNEKYSVSHRPIGLRPGKPQSLVVGFKINMR